jgi:7,8-dihydro-6-hydroxymethylpterin-pyrophosphokinase
MTTKTTPEEQLESSKRIEALLTRVSERLDQLVKIDLDILSSQARLENLQKLSDLEQWTKAAAMR